MFWQAQEDQHYNLQLFDEHQLAEGQIVGEQASDYAITAMVPEDLGFLDEQREMYQSMHSAHDIRRERWRLHVLHAESDALFVEIDT